MAKPQENVQAVVDVKKKLDDVLVGNNYEKMLDHEVKTENFGLFFVTRGEEERNRIYRRRGEQEITMSAWHLTVGLNRQTLDSKDSQLVKVLKKD